MRTRRSVKSLARSSHDLQVRLAISSWWRPKMPPCPILRSTWLLGTIPLVRWSCFWLISYHHSGIYPIIRECSSLYESRLDLTYVFCSEYDVSSSSANITDRTKFHTIVHGCQTTSKALISVVSRWPWLSACTLPSFIVLKYLIDLLLFHSGNLNGAVSSNVVSPSALFFSSVYPAPV